jgi:hypothetical protein
MNEAKRTLKNALATAWREFCATTAPERAALDEGIAAAWAVHYAAGGVPGGDVFEAALAPSRETYVRATGSAWAVYAEAVTRARIAYEAAVDA